jgi:DNA-binding CsgD family transcriptional regulator
MGLEILPVADAAVRRLTSGLFRIQADDSGLHLVHFPTDERVCVVRLTNDGPSPGGDCLLSLSARERRVLEMLGNGMDMHEIALQLGVSIKTAETYRARMKKKLGITNRTRLLAIAVEFAIEQRRTNGNTALNGRPA